MSGVGSSAATAAPCPVATALLSSIALTPRPPLPSLVSRAVTRFLFLNIAFETQLFVWEDDNAKTVGKWGSYPCLALALPHPTWGR